MLDRPSPKHFRTLFISDVHLGCRGCQAGLLLDFLRYHDAEQIYLVGDIVDGWRLKRGWYWPQEHNDVVQKLLRKARKGSRVVYVPGNHDEFLRDYIGIHFGGVEVVDRAIHETADGRKPAGHPRRLFDVVVRHAAWLAHLGAGAYNAVLHAQHRLQPHPPPDGAAATGRCRPGPSTRSRTRSTISARSRMRWPTRRGGSVPTASSAATSITPTSATPAASPTSTPATGWRAARRSPNITTAPSRSSAGPNSADRSNSTTRTWSSPRSSRSAA